MSSVIDVLEQLENWYVEISRKFEIQNILGSYIMRIIQNCLTLPQN